VPAWITLLPMWVYKKIDRYTYPSYPYTGIMIESNKKWKIHIDTDINAHIDTIDNIDIDTNINIDMDI
jgi:hypothetical protein